jgi:hypothetical protein
MANPQSEEFVDPITWRPDRGEHPTTIEGELIRVSAARGSFGRYPVIEIQEHSGPIWRVHVLHDVLKDELQDLAPQIGDRIQISFRGKTDRGRGYFGYRVGLLDGGRRPVDWSRFDGDLVGEEPLPVGNESSKVGSSVGDPASDVPAGDDSGSDDIPF